MANAAINILGDGSIYDICAVNGRVSDVSVTRTEVGTYHLTGTLGLVPPPDGWGVVTNPMDGITASTRLDNGILILQNRNAEGQLADIASKVTLHILVEDAAPLAMPTVPTEQQLADAQYAHLKAQADAHLQLLQDLLDIGEGSPEIQALALAWKRYRVGLHNVSAQPGYPLEIEWPPLPE